MVEHLRIWMGTVFTQSFDPSVADLVLDLIWSCEPRAFIPIRIAASLHAQFKADILACTSIADATLFFQCKLPSSVTVATIRSSLALGNWFYLDQKLPAQMQDALNKAPRQNVASRSRKLASELTEAYDITGQDGGVQDKVTETVSKWWSSAKTWGQGVYSQYQDRSGGPSAKGGKPQDAPKCPYHMYPCNCLAENRD
jgi:hypothetical protein